VPATGENKLCSVRVLHILIFIVPLFYFVYSGCTSRAPFDEEEVANCDASRCHAATPLGQFSPVSGNHPVHLTSSTDISCNDCHHGYTDHPLHKNGVINGYNSRTDSEASGIVIFFNQKSNPNGFWDNSSSACNNMSCHGSVGWNTTGYMGCALCHAPGTVNDPITINGSDDKGKHFAHVYNQSIDCEYCHYDYGISNTHRNGELDKGNPLATLVNFESDPGASWNNSLNTCNNMSCHGNADWYTAEQLGCIICHAPGTMYDPLTLNGTGSDGKHTAHVSNQSIDCEKCHLNYGSTATHRDGTLDTDLTANLIFFQTEPGAAWDNSSSTCSNLSCHGTIDWYTTTSMGCTLCHAPGTTYDPLTLNGVGSDGKHTAHVVNQSIDCDKCHLDYGSAATHKNGDLDTDGSALLISFEGEPGATWNNGTGFCGNLSCHGDVDWNTTVEQGCTFCHAPGSAYDPLSKGKHVRHVTDKSYSCITCHYDYKSIVTHQNGTVDRGPAIDIIAFHPDYSDASWTYSTCYNLSCHGAGNPDWFAVSITCRDCHVSGDATYDPLERNGTGINGKHVTHVNDKSYSCEVCHFTYRDAATHNNGQWDKGSDVPPVALVSFDSSNYPGATWSCLLSTCGSLWCHGAGTPDWYDTAPLTCRSCHVSGDGTFDPVERDGTLPSGGKHDVHLTTEHEDFFENIQCEICHYTYRNAGTHNNGEWNDGDPSGTPVTLIAFDPAYSGSWIYSTCQSIVCHGNDDWFTSSPMVCSNCHDSAYSTYHPVPDVQGEHSFHLGNPNVDGCESCHNGYTTVDTHHLNGVLDTPPYGPGSVDLIFFLDPTGYKLSWDNDSTGNCTRTATGPGCHGGWDAHPWYNPPLP